MAKQVRGVLKSCTICQMDNPKTPFVEGKRFIEPPKGPF